MSLEFAGVFHGQDGFFMAEVVLAEDVETIFLEVAVETGSYFGYLAFDYPA